jgi:membrane fusion protein (multidrug efflux system)
MGDLRVVSGEIAAGDSIIVEGLLRARPGARVVATPAAARATTADGDSPPGD